MRNNTSLGSLTEALPGVEMPSECCNLGAVFISFFSSHFTRFLKFCLHRTSAPHRIYVWKIDGVSQSSHSHEKIKYSLPSQGLGGVGGCCVFQDRFTWLLLLSLHIYMISPCPFPSASVVTLPAVLCYFFMVTFEPGKVCHFSSPLPGCQPGWSVYSFHPAISYGQIVLS